MTIRAAVLDQYVESMTWHRRSLQHLVYQIRLCLLEVVPTLKKVPVIDVR